MTTILVVGGAGYIGAHMLIALQEAGFEIIVLDDLSTGHREHILTGKFIEGSLADSALLTRIFQEHRIAAVMHFAAFIEVQESVSNPQKYYQNNVVNTLNLLNAMVKAQVMRFIFSSTAAIFGNPEYTPIDNNHPKKPINPYGRSKLMVEEILKDYEQAYGLKSVCLRYFNAAGADPLCRIGESHQPESHLIPLILQVASKRRDHIKIFGTDYPTPDGTTIRDYVHISDLCSAHLLALKALLNDHGSAQYNLGNGQGFSVKEVIAMTEAVTQTNIPVQLGLRRPGDPAILIADATLAKSALGWQPQYSHLKTIIQHAWEWEIKWAEKIRNK